MSTLKVNSISDLLGTTAVDFPTGVTAANIGQVISTNVTGTTQSSPTADTYYDVTDSTITLPAAGRYLVGYNVTMVVAHTSASTLRLGAQTALRYSGGALNNNDVPQSHSLWGMSGNIFTNQGGSEVFAAFSAQTVLTVTEATSIKLSMRASQSSFDTITIEDSNGFAEGQLSGADSPNQVYAIRLY